MKQLMKLRLFSLLTNEIESNQVTNEIAKAYEEFALKIFEKLKEEANLSELYYHLGFVRLELTGLRNKVSGEKGEKCLDFCK